MDNAEHEHRLSYPHADTTSELRPLLRLLRPDVRDLAVRYRLHTRVAAKRIELRIIDADGTIKELKFPAPETP